MQGAIAIALSACSMLFAGLPMKSDTLLKIECSPDRLKAHVERICATPSPRCFDDTATLDSVARLIRQTFESFGYQTAEQLFQVKGKTYRNVIAVAGNAQAKRLVIGAHYDVAGFQQGADDNASGVAGLLELARIAKENEKFLKHQVEFVAYSLEEPPNFRTENMGSYVHARSLADSGIKIECMIALEMLGYYSDRPNSQRFPLGILKLFYPDKGNFIAAVSTLGSGSWVKKVKKAINRCTSIRCCSLTAPSWVQGLDFSDHRNYAGFGFKALMITDTAFFRNPNYHSPSDRIQTLDFIRMAEVVKGVGWFLFS
jgi:Zn-dependent M28 family amino/carboxypeptidase